MASSLTFHIRYGRYVEEALIGQAPAHMRPWLHMLTFACHLSLYSNAVQGHIGWGHIG